MSGEPTRYEFGPFRLRPVERTLHRGPEPLALPPKAFDALVHLVSRAGHLVTKEDLLREVWPDTFVEEGNLSYTVSLIRKALGDHEGPGGLIETVPKRGYRFTADVATRVESETPARGAARHVPWRWVAPGLVASATAVGLLASFLGSMSPQAPEPAAVRSLAVLPLANLSGNPEQEYFTDGMTHALTAELSKLGSLHVISFASASRFRKTTQSAPEIGRALGVDGVIAGSVLRDANQVRITVQLVHAASDRQVWAESFVRDLRDVLSLQSDVARAVADAIRLALPARSTAGPSSRRLVDRQAYDSYLRGRHYWRKLTAEGMKTALTHFEAAIARDPELAPAYVGVAEVYTWSFGRLAADADDLTTRALSAVTKALALDETLADGHAVLGWIREWHLWDFAAAERSYRRAIELDPGAAQARAYYALFRLQHSDFAGAEAEARLASRLDPLSTVSRSTLGWVLFWSDRHADAIEVYSQVLDLDPTMPLPHYNLGLCYERQGRFAEAEARYRRAIELGGAWPIRAMLARTLALGGNRAAAARVVEELRAGQPQLHYMLALALLGLGDRRGAIAELERAVAEREPWTANLKRDHFFFTPLRGDSRFEALAQRMRFPGGYPPPRS